MKRPFFLLIILILTFVFISCNAPSVNTDETATAEPQQTTPVVTPEVSTTPEIPADPYARQTLEVTDVLEYVNIGGRHTVKRNGITFDWTCSYIEFNADCEGDVKLFFASANDLYLTVIVDGVMQEERVFVDAPSTVTVASGLEAGVHTIRVIRGNSNSSESSAAVISDIILNGSLLMPPARPEKLIEFVGDSITCGYGNLVPNGEPYSDAVTDPTQAYAYLTAWALAADYSMTSISGMGVAGKIHHNITMTDVYRYTNYYRDQTEEYSFERKADLVVVNLGTNDETTNTWGGGLDPEVFKAGVKDLLAMIREKNGDCKIIWVHDMMSDGYFRYTSQVLEELGGEDSGYYSIALTRDNNAADGHCSVNGHISSANTLAKYIYDNGLLN